jgi:hypothetical protein
VWSHRIAGQAIEADVLLDMAIEVAHVLDAPHDRNLGDLRRGHVLRTWGLGFAERCNKTRSLLSVHEGR